MEAINRRGEFAYIITRYRRQHAYLVIAGVTSVDQLLKRLELSLEPNYSGSMPTVSIFPLIEEAIKICFLSKGLEIPESLKYRARRIMSRVDLCGTKLLLLYWWL